MKPNCPFCEDTGGLVAVARNGEYVGIACPECCGGMGIPASAEDVIASEELEVVTVKGDAA